MFTKHFAVFCVVIFLSMMLYPNIVKAQQDETTHEYEAEFSNLGPPTEGEIVRHNVADPGDVKTEIDIWEQDLGKVITEGSYVGPLFESSLFEIDFEPKFTQQQYTYFQEVIMTHFIDPLDLQQVQEVFEMLEESVPEFYKTWPDLETFYSICTQYMYDLDLGNNPPGKSTTFPVAESRSVISLTQVVNFTNRVIMSGATEFWVKIPIHPSNIDFEEMIPSISLMELNEDLNTDKLWINGKHKIVYSPVPSQTNWLNYIDKEYYWVEPSETGRILSEHSNYETIYMSYGGLPPILYQQVTEQYMFENSLYTKINAPVEPNTDYIISFSAILNSKPRIYITEEELFNEGRNSILHIANIEYENMENKFYASTIGDLGISPVSEISTNYLNVASPINYSLEMPIDMSYSFIFHSGRGNYGMYGQKLEFKPNDSIVFYDKIDVSKEKYISMNIPFLSEKEIEVDITVEFLNYTNRFEPQGYLFYYLIANYDKMSIDVPSLPSWMFIFSGPIFWPLFFMGKDESPEILVLNGTNVSYHFGYESPFWWQSEKTMTYSDYILFTVPRKPYFEGIADIKTTITFVKNATATFLFTTLENDRKLNTAEIRTNTIYDNYGIYYYNINSGYYRDSLYTNQKVRSELTYIYNDVVKYPIFFGGRESKDDFNDDYGFLSLYKGVGYKRYIVDLNDNTIIHSELFRSVQMTTGMWHQLATSGSGHHYATKFFERRIAVGKQEYFIDTTNRSSEVKVNWYDNAAGQFQTAWEYLKKGDLINFVRYAFEGTISLLWDGLASFMGWIVGVFESIWDKLVQFGSFIKTVLLEFWDTIISIMADLVNNIAKILEVALYIIAIVIFAFVVSWSARFINLTSGGIDE